jgi:putative tricarboxylic transport membrane protein
MPEDVQPSPDASRAGEPVLTNKIKGGTIIAIVALLLLLSTFYVSSPNLPRIVTIVIALVGIAVAAGVLPVRAPQDFYGGLALVLMAAFAWIASSELPGQRGFAFGPGTAPRLFAIVLGSLGVVIALTGVLADGPRIEKYKLRGPVLVMVGISIFAALIRPFGLIMATYLAFIVSISGSKEVRWVEAAIAGAVMTLFCVLLFVYLLNLPFQLWPQSNAPQLLFNQFADIFKTIFSLIRKFVPGL